jgi:uncharacterized membrane protein YgcG
MQVVRWNPDHKFIHLRNGEPIVPFKELLKGKSGDERKELLYEVAMDVKEWRRWRHAKAVAAAAKRREKDARALAAGKVLAPPRTPEERWKQKVAKKRDKKANSWEGRGSRGTGDSRGSRGTGDSRGSRGTGDSRGSRGTGDSKTSSRW